MVRQKLISLLYILVLGVIPFVVAGIIGIWPHISYVLRIFEDPFTLTLILLVILPYFAPLALSKKYLVKLNTVNVLMINKYLIYGFITCLISYFLFYVIATIFWQWIPYLLTYPAASDMISQPPMIHPFASVKLFFHYIIYYGVVLSAVTSIITTVILAIELHVIRFIATKIVREYQNQ